jgi:hypothetical protein
MAFNRKLNEHYSSEQKVKEGLHAMVIIDLERRVKEGPEVRNPGEIQLAIQISIIENIDDESTLVSNANLMQWVELPICNEDFAGHHPSKWAMSRWQPLSSAVFPDDCPRKPYREKRGKPYYFKGEEIQDSEWKTYALEAENAAGDFADALDQEDRSGEGGGFQKMCGKPFWGIVRHDDNSKFVKVMPFPGDEVPLDRTGNYLEQVDPKDCMESGVAMPEEFQKDNNKTPF